MKIVKWIILALALAVNVFIIVNACMNGTMSAQESGRFSRFVAGFLNFFSPNYINDGNFDNFASIIRKLAGHFGLFCLNGILSTLSFHLFLKDSKLKSSFYVVGFSLGLGFLVAAVSELIQIFTPERYGSWLDILIDFSGYFLGFGLLIAVLLFFNFTSFKKLENI